MQLNKRGAGTHRPPPRPQKKTTPSLPLNRISWIRFHCLKQYTGVPEFNSIGYDLWLYFTFSLFIYSPFLVLTFKSVSG